MNYASMINHKSEIINHKSIGSTSSQRRHYDGKGRFVCISWKYVHTETGKFLTGEQRALFVNGNIVYNGRLFKEIFFEPASPSSSFELKAVTIGRSFHLAATARRPMFQRGFQPGDWRKWNCSHQPSGCGRISDQRHFFGNERAGFKGTVKGTYRHSTQLAACTDRKKNFRLGRKEKKQQNCYLDNEQLIRWYDREDHNIFDVCADDHCRAAKELPVLPTRSSKR